ncbi:diguanylate cyclase [Vibrio tritonius]|uniref:diguanylate cyclase n=1 Tax=Vibrio tritonius TaxID=1435069 RepID=A0ABS7YPC7_9VIBR|nr:sensor domain-containing diguanylate cyclase [Vibrio tritonius]MCA2017530.1 diguanylate cyclase [Vibrio tritonius]
MLKILQWYNASLSRRISSVFMVLLTILLIVIAFSISQLRVIDAEMKEVAYIDVPLNQIMERVQMLQLEQHILLEQFRLKESDPNEKMSPAQEFTYQKQQMKKQLDLAVKLLADSFKNNTVRFKTQQHHRLLTEIEDYHQHSDLFEQALEQVIINDTLDDAHKQKLERLASNLELSVKKILDEINHMTIDASRYTQKHEQEFLWINITLGICALLIGILLTSYIIQFFRKRIARMKHDITQIDSSLAAGMPLPFPQVTEQDDCLDEFSALERELKLVMGRLAQEIENRELVEQQLLRLATHDKLTGAYNRHKWDEQLKWQVSLGQQGSLFSLVLLDIDYFKRINDQFGHPVGDKVLTHLCQLIQAELDNTAMLFRIGGEEFAIILPLQNGQMAMQFAEKIRVKVEQSAEQGIPAYTVSMGVCEFQAQDSVRTLFNRVDQCLYHAKGQGRNQVILE